MTQEYQITPFVCAMCGNCCRGEGYVRIRSDEAPRIAAYLGLSLDDFLARYTRTPEIPSQAAAGDLWFIDKPGPEQECIFLENNLCAINPVKPEQCIGFPLKWRTPDIMEYCVGMQR